MRSRWWDDVRIVMTDYERLVLDLNCCSNLAKGETYWTNPFGCGCNDAEIEPVMALDFNGWHVTEWQRQEHNITRLRFKLERA